MIRRYPTCHGKKDVNIGFFQLRCSELMRLDGALMYECGLIKYCPGDFSCANSCICGIISSVMLGNNKLQIMSTSVVSVVSVVSDYSQYMYIRLVVGGIMYNE